MSTLASLQAIFASAQAAFNKAQQTVTALTSTVTATQARIAQVQAQITVLQATPTKSAVDRNRIRSQIRAAQATLTSLTTSLRSTQTSLVAATADMEKKKTQMDQAQAALNTAQVPLPATVPAPTVTPVFKRALLVGINYVNTQYELAGCINDVNNLKTQLQTFFPKLTDVTVLTDETPVKPSKANVLAAINTLVSGLNPGENIMFHFSGHGGRIIDKNGDEVSGYDSCIYPCNNGVLETISDDELRAEIAVKVPAGSKCFVVLDSCHSGTAVDLRYLWQSPSSGTISYSEDTKYGKTAGDVLFLSAASDRQTAADTADADWRPCGALTWALLDTWRSYGPAIKTKYLLWDVRNFLKVRGYTQTPQLSTGKYIDLQGVFNLDG